MTKKSVAKKSTQNHSFHKKIESSNKHYLRRILAKKEILDNECDEKKSMKNSEKNYVVNAFVHRRSSFHDTFYAPKKIFDSSINVFFFS